MNTITFLLQMKKSKRRVVKSLTQANRKTEPEPETRALHTKAGAPSHCAQEPFHFKMLCRLLDIIGLFYIHVFPASHSPLAEPLSRKKITN